MSDKTLLKKSAMDEAGRVRKSTYAILHTNGPQAEPTIEIGSEVWLPDGDFFERPGHLTVKDLIDILNAAGDALDL